MCLLWSLLILYSIIDAQKLNLFKQKYKISIISPIINLSELILVKYRCA